jgi:diphthamide biosynthesis protein 2
MGKPSPAKLGNFLDLDAFVLVACPENSLLDSKEFHVPVVTPHELLLALGHGVEWSGRCDLSLASVSGLIQEELDQERSPEDQEDEPYFSLVTGTYKMRGGHSQEESATSGAVTTRGEAGEIALRQGGSGAVSYFEARTYQGLVQALGETEIVDTVEGRAGIASGYTTEPVASENRP